MFHCQLGIWKQCYERYFEDVARANKELPHEKVKAYHKEHNKEFGTCRVCNFPIQTDAIIPHQELVEYTLKCQYATMHMNLQENNVLYRILTEEQFVTLCIKAIKIAISFINEVGNNQLMQILTERIDQLSKDELGDQNDAFDDGLKIEDFPEKSCVQRYMKMLNLDITTIDEFITYVLGKTKCIGMKNTPFATLLFFEIRRRLKFEWLKINQRYKSCKYDVNLSTILNVEKIIYEVKAAVDHDHYNINNDTKISGFVHTHCNSRLQIGKNGKIPEITVWCHNSAFDVKLLYQHFHADYYNVGPDDIRVRGASINNIKSLTVGNVYFKDTFNFLAESLDKIMKNSNDNQKKEIKDCFAHYFKNNGKLNFISFFYKNLKKKHLTVFLLLLNCVSLFFRNFKIVW